MMRRLFAVSFVMMLWAGGAARRRSAASSGTITGLFLTTRYPALTVRAGETTTVDLSLRNFKLPPQSLTISVPEVAQWLEGDDPRRRPARLGGRGRARQRGAAAVAAWSRLRTPARAITASRCEAKGGQHDEKLPITLTIGEELPGQAQADDEFPGVARHRDDLVQIPGQRHQRQRPRRDDQFQRRRAKEFPGQLHRSLWQPADHQHPDRGRQVEGCRGLADDPARDPGGRLQADAARQDRSGQRRAPGQPDDRRPAARRAVGRRRPAERRGLCRPAAAS